MKYKVGQVEPKTTQAGVAYKKINVKDEAGVITSDISIWSDCSQYNLAVTGATIEGVISDTGKYKNFKDGNLGARPAGIGFAGGAKAMERKEKSIEKFQDAKEYSIMVASTASQATEILTSILDNHPDKVGGVTEWKSEWIKIRYWLVENYNNVSQPKISGGEVDYPQAGIDDFDTSEIPF